jgi:CheY-like chemotaxis protein
MPEILKIVLADDDEDDRDFFQEAVQLTEIPILLTTVKNGLELMHLLQKSEKFDLIVLDVNMHLKNGIETLVEIRADKKHKETFCAILTTASNKHLEDDTLSKGANIFKTKPYNFDEYAANVKSIIMAYQKNRRA